MKIKEAMHQGVISIDKNATPAEAFKKLYSTGIRRLFVMDENQKAIGVLTYTDLIGIDITDPKRDKIKIHEILDQEIVKVNALEDVKNAANLMLRADVSGLLVVEQNQAVGVITKTDICRLVAAGHLVDKEKK